MARLIPVTNDMANPTGNTYPYPGLGDDLLTRPRYLPPQGLAGNLLQGIPGFAQAPGGAIGGQAAIPATPQRYPRVTDQNVWLLGTILTSECQRVCNPAEVRAVGSTLINRMDRASTDDVTDVAHGYSLAKDPSPGMMFTAIRLLSGQLPDNTGGATNFYSPRSMPEVGQDTTGHDIGGGQEQISGHPPTWRPGFATTFPQTTVPDVRDWVLKLYAQPGTGRVY